MKKVLIVALHLNYGGVESALCNLANMLCDDYQVEILSFYHFPIIPFDLDRKVHVTYLTDFVPNRQEFLHELKSFHLFRAFKEGIKAFKILFLRRYKVKQYLKKDKSDVIISSRVLYHDIVGTYGNCHSLKIAQEHAHHNENKSYIKKVVKGCENLDFLIPVSQELTEFYKPLIHCSCVYIRHSLDRNVSIHKKYHVDKGLISVGRLSPEKGYMDLIDVFALLKVKLPSITLDIYGDGVEKENLENKIETLGLQKDIILHGFCPKKVINKNLQSSTLYLMTSFEESFGLVLIEAMAQGIPCIAFSSAQGAREIINGKNGFLISDRNKKAMVDKIVACYKDTSQLEKMNLEALKTAQEYLFSNVKEEWLSFLNENMKG